jgi:hypothetical protein
VTADAGDNLTNQPYQVSSPIEYQKIAGNMNNNQSKLNFDNNMAKDTPVDKRRYFRKDVENDAFNANTHQQQPQQQQQVTRALNYSNDENNNNNNNTLVDNNVDSRVGDSGQFVDAQYKKAKTGQTVERLFLSRQGSSLGSNGASSINQSQAFKDVRANINNARLTNAAFQEQQETGVNTESLYGKRSASHNSAQPLLQQNRNGGGGEHRSRRDQQEGKTGQNWSLQSSKGIMANASTRARSNDMPSTALVKNIIQTFEEKIGSQSTEGPAAGSAEDFVSPAKNIRLASGSREKPQRSVPSQQQQQQPPLRNDQDHHLKQNLSGITERSENANSSVINSKLHTYFTGLQILSFFRIIWSTFFEFTIFFFTKYFILPRWATKNA